MSSEGEERPERAGQSWTASCFFLQRKSLRGREKREELTIWENAEEPLRKESGIESLRREGEEKEGEGGREESASFVSRSCRAHREQIFHSPGRCEVGDYRRRKNE